MQNVIEFAPKNIGRYVVWGATALVLLLLPLLFSGGFALSLLSQMGIFIIFALAYNMIFGQGGMLSFGHAVYSGLGAYFSIHALNMAAASNSWLASPITVAFLPLVGGLFGALSGVVFGYVTTKKSGTPFAMITMGLVELVFACSLMFPAFFGGEGGISGNRVMGNAIAGVNFGSNVQVYYLVAFWCFVSMVAMFAFSHTPLGRISNAVRDNPERAEFIGYNTQRVRYFVLIASGFFAGISGALAAVNFEIVTAENVSAVRSGGVLLAAFIGGATFFFGPVLGSIVFVFFAVALSEYTKAWQLYLGLFFVIMVLFAPGGLASLVLMNLRVAKYGLFRHLRDGYAGVFMAGLLLLLSVVVALEMGYHLTLDGKSNPVTKVFGFTVDTSNPTLWVVAVAALAFGIWAFHYAWTSFHQQWNAVQVQIEEQIAKESRA
jgi:branched-chain amino acid transport system permease protein